MQSRAIEPLEGRGGIGDDDEHTSFIWLFIGILAANTPAGSDSEVSSTASSLQDSQQSHINCSTSSTCTSPWQCCAHDGACTCGEIPAHMEFSCNIGENLSLYDDYCVTMNREADQRGYSTYIGNCIYKD